MIATVEAGDGTRSRTVSWTVYETGPRKAKNVILFVGDGMGVATVTAARILEGQRRGELGEENLLAFERFPHLALSKTYSSNCLTTLRSSTPAICRTAPTL